MIAIIDYKTGNLRSVQKAFNKCGYACDIISAPSELKNYSHVVLPGVGSFNKGMSDLSSLGFAEEIKEFALRGGRLFGICLGFQFLFDRSYEEGETKGLGLIGGDIKRFDVALKVPHIGWNDVKTKPCAMFSGVGETFDAYFVHSYYAPLCADTIGTANYQIDFTAAVCRGNVWGTQFHPEKSGEIGLKILANFAKSEGV